MQIVLIPAPSLPLFVSPSTESCLSGNVSVYKKCICIGKIRASQGLGALPILVQIDVPSHKHTHKDTCASLHLLCLYAGPSSTYPVHKSDMPMAGDLGCAVHQSQCAGDHNLCGTAAEQSENQYCFVKRAGHPYRVLES